MATTTNLALNQPAYNSSAWDVPLNYNETILDKMFGSTTSVAVSTSGTSGYTTITAPSSSGTGSTSQAMRFLLTGALAANQTVLLPQSVAGMWIVTNNTSGAYTVSIASDNGSTAPAGNSLVVPQGFNIIIFSDGTNLGYSDEGILTTGTVDAIFSSITVNGKSSLNGSTSALAAVVPNIAEKTTISATAATGTINFDVTTQSILYYTSNATAAFTLNVRGNSSTSLNTLLSTGQTITVVFLNTNGTTAYLNSVFKIDGTTITVKWTNGITPSANASSIDAYTYTIIKTASATYTVLGNLSKFA